MTPPQDESPQAEPESNPVPHEWIDRSAPLWIEVNGTPKPSLCWRRWLWPVVAAVTLLVGYNFMQAQQKHATRPTIIGPISSSEATHPTPANSAASQTAPRIMVHIVGKVKRPGVYEFPSNARVRDAIARAGGAAAGADLDAVNLAAWLEDGKQIEVPSKVVASNTDRTRDNSHHVAAVADDSTLPRPATRTKRLSTQRSTSRRASTSLQSTLKPSAPVPSQAAVPDRPIDLNRANSEDLELLPGIGPAIAARIVQYREENGDFATVDELDEVKGIGEKKLEKLRPFVFVR